MYAFLCPCSLGNLCSINNVGGRVEGFYCVKQVESGMIESIHEVCTQGVETYSQKPRHEWVLEWPGQVVLVVTAIFWTMDVENAIQSGRCGALKEVSEDCTSQLADIVNLVRGDLHKLCRMTLSALVVMDVHARDVVTILAEEKIEGEMNHFSWMCQLRTYWEVPLSVCLQAFQVQLET